jgi:acyl carrier protein
MVDVRSDAKPAAAALVTGTHTPEGRSVATSLASAGYRVCLLTTAATTAGQRVDGLSALDASSLPGHARLRHESVALPSFDPAALAHAARRAQELLGHVTALVHVAALPAASSAPDAGIGGDELDAAAFAAELAAAAGVFLTLGLALLPGMFGTQTGALCLLIAGAKAGFSHASPGSGAWLGAALGAVRELADRTAGTPLRSIALCTDAERGALPSPALAKVNAQLGSEVGPGQLASGWFASLTAAAIQGPIEFLRSAPAPVVAAPLGAVAGAGPKGSASGQDPVALQLAQTFRLAFGLAPHAEVSNLAVSDVQRWDSLGHLKLMMEVEQTLRVRLPAESLSRIQSYKDLEKAVRANLPVR